MGVDCPGREPSQGMKRWRHSGDHSIAIRSPPAARRIPLTTLSPGWSSGRTPVAPDSTNVSLLPFRPCRNYSTLNGAEVWLSLRDGEKVRIRYDQLQTSRDSTGLAQTGFPCRGSSHRSMQQQ